VVSSQGISGKSHGAAHDPPHDRPGSKGLIWGTVTFTMTLLPVAKNANVGVFGILKYFQNGKFIIFTLKIWIEIE